MSGIDFDPQPPEPSTGIEALDFVSPNVNQPGVSGELKGQTTVPPTPVSLVLLDVSAQRQVDVRKVGVYFAGSTFISDGAEGGYALFRRRKDTGAFRPVRHVATLTGYGMTRDGSFGLGLRDLFDLNAELTVEISSGPVLVSVTEDEMLSGANRANVDGELIAFQNVELIDVEFDARIYKLTKFLRGIGDTPMQAFTNGMRFTPWNVEGPVGFDDYSNSDIGSEYDYKAIPVGFAESDVSDVVSLAVSGRTIRNRAPTDVRATDEENGDVTISWHRKVQIPFRLLAGILTPLEETLLGFRIILFDDLGAELRRFEPLELAPSMNPEITSVTYTDAQQTTDSVMSGDEITITVLQVSDLVRDGFETTIVWAKP